MVLTVGDIRKALAEFSDDTVIADDFGETWKCIEPVEAANAFEVERVDVDKLKRQSTYWQKCPKNVTSAITLHIDFWNSSDYSGKTDV